MKTWVLVSGILLLGALLGYLLFLLNSPNSFIGSQATNSYNGTFQNKPMPVSPYGPKSSDSYSPFQTQSYTDKTIVIE